VRIILTPDLLLTTLRPRVRGRVIVPRAIRANASGLSRNVRSIRLLDTPLANPSSLLWTWTEVPMLDFRLGFPSHAHPRYSSNIRKRRFFLFRQSPISVANSLQPGISAVSIYREARDLRPVSCGMGSHHGSNGCGTRRGTMCARAGLLETSFLAFRLTRSTFRSLTPTIFATRRRSQQKRL